MKREQFTFYRSYYEALQSLPPKEFKAAVLAVCAYALDQEQPSLTGVSNSVFVLIRPTLDSGRNKAANRLNKRRTNEEQTDNKKEQTSKEKEREKEGKREGERENDSSISPNPSFNPPTLQEVQDFASTHRYLSDPKRFFDYYAAAGWRDRDGTPINWRQRFMVWEAREQDRIRKQPAQQAGMRESWADLADRMDREGIS